MMRLDIPDYAARVIAALENAGYEAFAVGGCVRDTMLGKTPNDWDVTTSAKPHEVRRLFSFLYGFAAIPTGIEHGTVTVLSDGEPVEVTTYRIDGEYTDCRRPDSVEFCDDLSLDLARRDFTVNAMAYSHERGLVDLYGGANDLAKGIIRCVGDAECRFREDALRILRAVRFASVLGFSLDTDTYTAAVWLKGLLSHVSRERVGAELSKLVCGKAAAKVMEGCLPIIAEVLPALADKCSDAVLMSMSALCGENLPLMYAALLAEVEPSEVSEILWSVRLDKKTAHRAGLIAEYRCVPLPDKAAVKRLCRNIGADAARDVIKLGIARGERERGASAWLDEIVNNGECVSLARLAVGGRELTELGIEPKKIGKCLDSLLDKVISGELENEKEILLEAVRTQKNI